VKRSTTSLTICARRSRACARAPKWPCAMLAIRNGFGSALADAIGGL